jgi:hypothetical protein
MERVAALTVRWGAAFSAVIVVMYFIGQSVTLSPDDGVGLELGMAVIAAGALLISASFVSLSALILWWSAIVKRSSSAAIFENERIIGIPFLIIAAVVLAFFL